MITLCWCDGTWAASGGSLVSEAIRTRLADTHIRFEYVRYPAQLGPATGGGDMSLAASVEVGTEALRDAVRATRYPAIVGGYSQGAMVAVRFARDVLPSDQTLDVRAVATAGDPHQVAHSGRAGIAGPLVVPRQRVSVWAPGDPIADLPLGSPLRSVADIAEWMSIRSAPDALRWGEETLAKVPTRLQRWWEPWRWPDLAAASGQVQAYLGTAHTADYVTGGYVDRLVSRLLAL